jgi:hypothetical protein
MTEVKALYTKKGLDFLSNGIYSQITSFNLIGSENSSDEKLMELVRTPNKTREELKKYFINDDPFKINNSYFDEEGILSFSLVIPYSTDYKKYLYGVTLELTEKNETVSYCSIPLIFLENQINIEFTYKVKVRGEPSAIVFRNSDYITSDELNSAISAATSKINKKIKVLENHIKNHIFETNLPRIKKLLQFNSALSLSDEFFNYDNFLAKTTCLLNHNLRSPEYNYSPSFLLKVDFINIEGDEIFQFTDFDNPQNIRLTNAFKKIIISNIILINKENNSFHDKIPLEVHFFNGKLMMKDSSRTRPLYIDPKLFDFFFHFQFDY